MFVVFFLLFYLLCSTWSGTQEERQQQMAVYHVSDCGSFRTMCDTKTFDQRLILQREGLVSCVPCIVKLIILFVFDFNITEAITEVF